MYDMSLEKPKVHYYAHNTVQHERPQENAYGKKDIVRKDTGPQIVIKKNKEKKTDSKDHKKCKLYELEHLVAFEIIISHSYYPAP